MEGYAFYLIVFVGFIVSFGQCQAASSAICWDSKWFNSSAPTQTNRSEYEQQSAKVLNSVCSHGPIIAARCKDSKGEAFTGFRNDTVIKYIARCGVINGLICNPFNTSKDSICPDFQIQYGCTCTSTTPNNSGGGSSASGGGIAGNGSGSGLRGNGSGGGGNGASGNGNIGITKTTKSVVGTSGPGSGKNTGNSGSRAGSGTGKSKGSENGVSTNIVSYLLLLTCVFLNL